MADKKVTIGIDTTANTSGAEEAADAIDKVVEKGAELDDALAPSPGGGLEQIPEQAAPAVAALDEVADKAKDAESALDKADGKLLKKIKENATPAVGSIRQLEEEVQRLQKELAEIPVGSAQFAAMAEKVRAAQTSLQSAELEARKLGATMGRRNLGGAVLELSRGFEDAQYGIRGVLNNIPGLITMLGGGPGLAGAISIAAVAGNILWEKLGNGSKKTEEDLGTFAYNTKKLLDGLKDTLGEVAADQAKLYGDELANSFNSRKAAIGAEKAAMDGYIESLKLAIEHEATLAKYQTEAAIRKVDQREREGEITPSEGDDARLKIRIAAANGDLARQKELDDLEAKKATSQKLAAEKAKKLADDELKAAGDRLAEQIAQAELLKKQINLRTNLEKQIEGFDASIKRNKQDVEDNDAEARKLSPTDTAGKAYYAEIATRLKAEGDALADNITKINERIAKEAPEPVKDFTTKKPDGTDEVIKPQIVKDLQALSNGDASKGIESLNKLSDAVVGLKTKADDAATALKAAEAAEKQKQDTAAQKDTNRKEVAAVGGETLKQVERDAAAATIELMQAILDKIPEGAKGAETNAIVDKIKSLTGDGQQGTEIEEAARLLGLLQAKLDQNDSSRATLYKKISERLS